MTGQLHIRRLDAADLPRYRPYLIDLYREVYAEPPYLETDEHVAAYIQRFAEESSQPGFALVIAKTDTEVVGYAYGHAFPADEWWPDTDHEPIETKGRTKFAVIELAVRKPHRGQGLGTQLMTALLDRRPEHLATLCSNPAAAARYIYQHWGWQPVATAYPPGIPPMDVLVLQLRETAN